MSWPRSMALSGDMFKGDQYFLGTLEVSKNIFGPIHPSVVESRTQLRALYENRHHFPQTDMFVQRGLVMPEGAEVDVEKLVRTGSFEDLGFSYSSFGQNARTISLTPKSAVLRNDGIRAVMELL